SSLAKYGRGNHIEEALNYWLSPGRDHDCIIVKIDPVPQDQAHHCVSAGRGTRNRPPLVTEFEFGTQDSTGTTLNIVQGQHDFKQPDPPAPTFILFSKVLEECLTIRGILTIL
ncbi:7960_t:CDS:2, partial [Acaulospora morrowiae]